MYSGASNIDMNADASLTVMSTALTAFMQQAALFPLFGMIAGHQIMLCRQVGMLGIVDETGFSVNLLPSDQSTDSEAITGQCLTLGAQVLAQYPTDDPKGLISTVLSLTANALDVLMIQTIEPVVHTIDAGLTYMIGVVDKIGDLVMSQNMAKCNPPSYDLPKIVQCACGDTVLAIQPARATEGIANQAFWCSGVLSMVDSNGQALYVYNPYTYAELQAKASGLQAYLDCTVSFSGGYSCKPPSDPVFDQQGVSLLNVLVKCRDNYVKNRWDPAAYVLYQMKYRNLLRIPQVIPVPPPDPFGVHDCMTAGQGSQALSATCLETYLLALSWTEDDYWQYQMGTQTGPEFVDGCLVFSGPAALQKLPAFAQCTDGPQEGQCSLPGHCWSPQSPNSVPVCEQHRVIFPENDINGLIQQLYSSAQSMVLSAIQASVEAQKAGSSLANASFFSVEGDVLHQTMDCIFMGPYSRVDYWPIPPCEPGQECLEGPYWSRDTGAGASRNVDPVNCPADSTLPYTCGSPGRRALMRRLVLDILPSNGATANTNTSLLHEMVLAALNVLNATWNSTANFGCPCPGRKAFLPSCCQSNSSFLPPPLMQDYTTIPAQAVLTALEDDLQGIFNLAMDDYLSWRKYLEEVAPGESAKYDWRGSLRVQDEARLNPGQPATTYQSDEALNPVLYRNASMWDVCHAALKQVLFTLPLDASGVVFDIGQFNGSAAQLEEYVKAFTAQAFLLSPLYRHYSPRHQPSESQMCASPPSGDDSEGTLAYADAIQPGISLSGAGVQLPTFPVYSQKRFSIGETQCLCGWKMSGSMCQAPVQAATHSAVCNLVKCNATFWYPAAMDATLLAAFQPSWYCPEVELSPHWGLADPAFTEQWLGAAGAVSGTTSSRDLLVNGRSGLRIGNVRAGALAGLSKQYISPKTREIPVENGRLTTCQSSQAAWSTDLTQQFLDQLFPAAQGVEEPGAVAYCLRYVIELARLQILNMTGAPLRDTVVQRELAESWRVRCGAQLQLMHLCVSFDIFRPPTSTSGSFRKCPHFAAAVGGDYVTPNCLVNVAGTFYDPCRCLQCSGQASLVLLASEYQLQECLLAFDPRTMVSAASPIGWYNGDAPDEPMPQQSFVSSILSDPDGAANMQGDGDWWSAEGLMADNALFCDMVLDWWPDAWDFPVGYHVTVPCMAEDAAYRSFMQAFALDGPEDSPYLTYQHDLLRDVNLVDTHFGVGGLCRTVNFGMPVVGTNTMRYCTAVANASTGAYAEDFTVPGLHPANLPLSYMPMQCSPSSDDVPWPDASQILVPYSASLNSVGTVPNMPEEGASTYPGSLTDMRDLGPWQEFSASGTWGKGDYSCSDYNLYTCQQDQGCPPGYSCRGRSCEQSKEVSCSTDADCPLIGPCVGLCVDSASVQCIKHSDCANDRMCSGVGTCEQPVVAVENKLQANNISFFLSVGDNASCGAASINYSLLGGSFWAFSDQDLLRAHGMCSFEDWFKYTSTTLQPGCVVEEFDDHVVIDPTTCLLVNLQEGTTNETKWWTVGKSRPDMLFLRPMSCDRDYERLEGFTQCAPVQGQGAVMIQGSVNGGQSIQSTSLDYDQFVRLHDSQKRVPIAKMPFSDNADFGFLGVGEGYTMRDFTGTGENIFISCSTLGQCYPANFTVNGNLTNRTVLKNGVREKYPDNTPFKCGAFGIDYGTYCAVDLDVFPVYRALCQSPGIPSCQSLVGAQLARVCTAITQSYLAQDSQRKQVLQGLVDIFYVFPAFSTLDQYLDITTCMDGIYTDIKRTGLSNGLYFPTMFALYEFPFDWFYQCMVMQGKQIDATYQGNQDCNAYLIQNSIDSYIPLSNSGDSWQTYLQIVRGGYFASDVTTFVTNQSSQVNQAIQASINQVIQGIYSGKDESYPVCSENLLWDVGPFGQPYTPPQYDFDRRKLIFNWYDTQSCQVEWQSELIASLEQDDIPADEVITAANWFQILTVYDPVYVTPQDPTTPSLLQLFPAYMNPKSSASLVPYVLPQDQAYGVITLDTDIPSDPSTFNLLQTYPSLVPQTIGGGNAVFLEDSSVNQTCAFKPSDDPQFQAVATGTANCINVVQNGAMNQVNTLVQCQQLTCSVIPTVYLKDGKFYCRYRFLDTVLTHESECSEDNPSCASDVVTSLYNAVRGKYALQRPSAAVLRTGQMPWFNRTESWGFQGFDLTDVIDYQLNIQPNPNKGVMCEVDTTASEAIQFSDCQNPHYATLKRHVNTYFKHDGPVIIPALAQLEWPVGRSTLAAGVLLSYANTNRSSQYTYVDSLFDDSTVCKGVVTENQRICWRQNASKFDPINPWMLGNFNPFSMCDVDFLDQSQGGQEYIYSTCVDNNALCKTGFDKSAVYTACNNLANTLVSTPGVPRTSAGADLGYNLCYHTLQDYSDGCMHDQGLLGGFDGLPVGALPNSQSMIYGTKYDGSLYRVSINLYEESEWGIPDDFNTGIMEYTNPLWSGQFAPYGFIKINENEIGGHRIGLQLFRFNSTDVISQLSIAKLPLQTEEDKVLLSSPQSVSLPVGQWVPNLQADMQADSAANSAHYLASYGSNVAASCPLQRWAFYSGNYPSFSPTIPSPKRSSHLFYRIHGGLLAHPTMTQVQDGRYLGVYLSSNGFCACPVLLDIPQEQCMIPITEGGQCSLLETVQALAGTIKGGYAQSFVFTPRDARSQDRPCTMQLDWPNVNNTLRDGSSFPGVWTAASSPTSRQCHVLDRFIPFRYSYQSAPTLSPTGLNTVSAGACQTGRLVQLNPAAVAGSGRCVRASISQSSAAFTCNKTKVQRTMPRMVPLSVKATLQRRLQARQPCSKCSQPPVFKTQAGHPIPPESSFGRLFRPSMERLLAKDLRDTLCNITGECPAFNSTAWRPGNFLRAYLERPSSLFLWQEPHSPPPKLPVQPPEPASVWEGQGWVYCPTPNSLKTGQGCSGTIPRSQWQSDRAGTCSSMVRDLSLQASNGTSGDPVARTLFCNIDSTTSQVCSAITDARALVYQANCIASGNRACMPSPFVYHPATYEPSNNAWVHDTVGSFYYMLDSTACGPQLDKSSLSFLSYQTHYMQTCPANSVQLIESLLKAVRTVITDIALLVTTMASMAFKLFGLLVLGQEDTFRASMASDWAYLKKKGAAMMSSASDFMTDALLRSGPVGLRIATFLDRTCEKINSGLNWFLNVWCKYIQKYMIALTAALKQLTGMVGAGFDVLNDFMNEVFQGILPEAFAAKYGNDMFQDLLEEKYSEPAAHEDKVSGKKHVPESVDVHSVSKAAPSKNFDYLSLLKKVVDSPISKTASKALAALGPIGDVVAFGLQTYDQVNQIISIVNDAKKQAYLASIYPPNFTLFDLSDVVNVFDDMEEFLSTDQTCFVYDVFTRNNVTYQPFPCIDLNMSDYHPNAPLPANLDATQCWADAQPSLGQSSLLSCTASSTCCQTSECASFIPCASCPATFAGTSQYGCDSLQERCVCGLVSEEVDDCSSNSQCDASSQCALVSSVGSQSYGSIPCGQCPASTTVLCLLPPSGLPGQCSCVMGTALQYDLCADASGTATVIDGSRLCGYVPGYSGRSTVWAFDMGDLIILPCSYATVGICSVVTQALGTTLQMVVAVAVQTSGRRRLLMDEREGLGPPQHLYESEYEQLSPEELDELLRAEGWNTTAAPCSALALAYQMNEPLGVLDAVEAQRCGYWRFVGARVIKRHQLEALRGHPTFLLSVDDFANSLMEAGVMRELVWHPGVFVTAMLYHPWMRPLRAVATHFANVVEAVLWARSRRRANQSPPPVATEEPSGPEEYLNHSRRLLSVPGPRRRLAQTVQQGAAAVQPLAGASPVQADALAAIPPLLASAWSTAAFVWPPAYDFSLQTCPLGLSTLGIGRQALSVTKLYYQNFNKPPRPIDRSLRATLPDWAGWNVTIPPPPARQGAQSWASVAFHWLLSLVGVTPAELVAFFTTNQPWSLQWMLDTAVECDLASVQTCSRHSRDLIMSTVVFGLLYAGLSVASSALGFALPVAALLVAYPSFILWYAFGVAPTCFPLVPTCLLGDVISAVQYVAPNQIVWPPALLQNGTLRPCDAFNFTTWADPLAFAVCDTDLRTGAYLAGLQPPIDLGPLDPFVQTLLGALNRTVGQALAPGYDPAAYRVCAWVTFIESVPAFALAVSALVLVGAGAVALLELVPHAVALLCQSFAFHQTDR